MEKEEAFFHELREQVIAAHDGAHAGTMMGLTGIQYNKKNFTFYYRKGVAFRTGRDFEPESEGIHDYDLLNPFKNKPPLKDWFVMGVAYQDKWPLLVEIALQKIKKE